MWATKDFRLDVKEIDGTTGEFTGHAAAFGNVDLQGDLIEPGAFAKTIADRNGRVPILWQHDPYNPIGVSTSMSEDEKGLAVVGVLNQDVQQGREARALLQQGALGGLSIGYRTIKEQMDGKVRRLKEVALREFSPVTFPANPAATVLTIKSIGRVDLDELAELLSDETLAEVKAGRVLSAANRTLVQNVVEALNALLSASEPPAKDTPPEEAAEAAEPDLSTLRQLHEIVVKSK